LIGFRGWRQWHCLAAVSRKGGTLNQRRPMIDLWKRDLPVLKRGPVLGEILSGYFADRPIDALEIGVRRGGMLKALRTKEKVTFKSYVGVDPYLGDTTDPYLGSYWKDRAEADATYEEAKLIYQEHRATLLRQKSEDFFEALAPDVTYDFIFVDGDHRYEPALKDLRSAWPRVRPGGLMVVDDYWNLVHSGVTKAINLFVTEHRAGIGRIGHRVLGFDAKGYMVPVSTTVVFFEKLSQASATVR
jgi:Methyltransferase domain